MRKVEILLLLVILVGGFLVRIYKFSSPIADWHSWRQSDTSAVSRNFVKFGYDILHPRFDDLSNGVSLIDNPHGYRFVEFPFYNILQADLFEMFGALGLSGLTLEQWGRLVSIFSSLIGTVFLYLLVKKHVSSRAGLIGSFFYAFIPYNIYYSRVVLPDALMVMAFLGGLYFFDQFLDKSEIRNPSFDSRSGRPEPVERAKSGTNSKFEMQKYAFYWLAVVFTAVALLIKPFVAFFFLAFLYLVFMKYGLKGFKRWEIWLFFILTTLPFFLWRMWMQNFPEGIPRNDWLYNGNGIRFKGAFYWWIFAERISRIILGFWGLPFVVLGMLFKTGNKEKWLFFTFVISTIAYVHVFATGNVQHDYYQILIIPTLAIFFGKGIDGALSLTKDYFNYWATRITIFVCLIFMFVFGWYFIRDFYSIQHPAIVEAGRAVDELTPKNAKVIAVYNGDTTFLYHTNRQGWPVFERTLREFKKAGATHIAFANPTKEELNFSTLFEPLKITDSYAIFDLTKPTPLGLKELRKK